MIIKAINYNKFMLKIFTLIFFILISSSAFSFELSQTCMKKKITTYIKTRCVYCIKLRYVLTSNDIEFKEVDISNNKILFNWLIQKTSSYTVPYVFLDNEFIGGYTEFMSKCNNKNK